MQMEVCQGKETGVAATTTKNKGGAEEDEDEVVEKEEQSLEFCRWNVD